MVRKKKYQTYVTSGFQLVKCVIRVSRDRNKKRIIIRKKNGEVSGDIL